MIRDYDLMEDSGAGTFCGAGRGGAGRGRGRAVGWGGRGGAPTAADAGAGQDEDGPGGRRCGPGAVVPDGDARARDGDLARAPGDGR